MQGVLKTSRLEDRDKKIPAMLYLHNLHFYFALVADANIHSEIWI